MSKRFKFRLETVRRVRKRHEDDCRRVVAQRLRRIGEVQGRMEHLQDQVRQTHEAMRDLVAGGAPRSAGQTSGGSLDMTYLRRQHVYLNHLHKSIDGLGAQLTHLQAELRREQGVLAEASRQVKVLDKLKERQQARHELTARRVEQAEADEVAMTFARRRDVAPAPCRGSVPVQREMVT